MMKNLFPKNRRGVSLSGWTEVGLFTILFIVILTTITIEMNMIYDKNNDGSFGLATSESQAQYQQFQEDLQNSVRTGEAQANALTGVSLTSSWAMAKTGAEISWSIVSGAWIRTITGLIGLPSIVGIIFQMLYVISIGFIIIKLLFKVNP